MNNSLNRRHLLAISASFGAALALPSAHAQSWPGKPVRLIVPFAAGGSTDVLARMLGQKLGELWGQPVLIDNRAGAGGNIGTDIVAKAAPDGYTLVFASGSITINPAIYATMPFDTMRDLTPITNVANGPMLVVVQDKAPWRNVKELIQYAKSNPGKINFGSAGIGSQVHLASEKFADAAAIDITHIPYRGEAIAYNDLISGQVQMVVGNIAAASALVGPGRLRALAVTGSSRSALLPDVPTVAESAIPGFEYAGWFGILGPAGLPRPIVDKIYQDTVRVMGESQIKGRLFVAGMKPILNTPQELTAQMDAELKSWAQIVKSRKVKAS
ncbi:MAG: tripartite tricarboxylate transporter substrate binding protein [Polaromonas sp.]|jgi:tripartite-type tricarboxylate transporter receptor subunit TctC|nr:tripartite tricarboxylate transporter substrate binding protein [Polaromonas sp.]MBP6089264.1 tripartite tricarboxylate transporter substrate binding protein [Polaromonas sp.]MBP6142531.1 tripartite tricarboxylate transporter substrate binding protein [Polaromonas sp.]MBP6156909.1 tripartite tricarboxylate transporter substrate binding protein [Polaromonas sp.]MBP7116110.1 tripartite tricarboxylate transporter substrate binding protein [Polaromonas sp.]